MSPPLPASRTLAVFLATLLATAWGLPARADSVVFVLKDLVLDGPAGQNGVTAPLHVAAPGDDGHLIWTYPAGNFAAGSATVQDLLLPIHDFPIAEATLAADETGIAGSQPGNTHDTTFDFTITFAHALTGPTSLTSIDAAASPFDFTGYDVLAPGVSFYGEWLGHISGSVVPLGTVLAVEGGRPPAVSFAAPGPNPAARFTQFRYALPREGEARLRVFDATGRLVRELAGGSQSAGAHAIAWDLRDATGRPAGAGLYFAALEFAGRTLTRRVAIAR